MGEILIERKADGTYVALRDNQPIVDAPTLAEAEVAAQRLHPEDVLIVRQVRFTEVVGRDQWRNYRR